MRTLEVSRADVVDDRVTEDVIEGVLLRAIPTPLSDNDGQFDLIVQLGSYLRIPHKILAVCDDGRRRLRKELRHFRYLRRRISRAIPLRDVIDVVSTDAEDVLSGTR